jgi:neurofibromin 1
MQNLANGILFGAKEQFMMPLNDFLTANTPLVKDFLTDLAVWKKKQEKKKKKKKKEGGESGRK